jgi:hypothetical protein
MTRRLRRSRLAGRVSADLIVVVVLFAALVAFAAYTTARRPEKEAVPDYSTHSTAPRGAAALYLWLQELGYRVGRIENGPFRVAGDAQLLFVLAPLQPYTIAESRMLEEWAGQAGHTLVLVSEGWQAVTLIRRFDIASVFPAGPAGVLTPTVPLLTDPPPGAVQAEVRFGLQPQDDDFVAHLQAGDAPVMVSMRRGGGRLIVTTAARPFTNDGLHDPGSARLVYNLLADLGPGALIQFDEVHHGYGASGTGSSLLAWLFSSPWGWALLYGTAVTLGWIALRGRRFGRAVPLPEQARRRPQSEYVVSMAGLLRRGGRRTFVLRHHHDRLKRELARPWRLNPDLPDDAFVAGLASCRTELDAGALRALLARLSVAAVGEGEMVRLVGQVDAWLKGHSTGGSHVRRRNL